MNRRPDTDCSCGKHVYMHVVRFWIEQHTGPDGLVDQMRVGVPQDLPCMKGRGPDFRPEQP